MAQLQTHPLPDLVALTSKSGVQAGRPWTIADAVQPGQPVAHRDDPKSFGMVLSRRWIWDDQPMQCEVLWSREPKLIPEIKTNLPSPRLPLPSNQKWTVTIPNHIGNYAREKYSRTPHEEYEVEEEYEHLDYDEVRRFREEGAHVTLGIDGRVTVKRKTDRLPEESFDTRGNHIRTRVTRL